MREVLLVCFLGLVLLHLIAGQNGDTAATTAAGDKRASDSATTGNKKGMGARKQNGTMAEEKPGDETGKAANTTGVQAAGDGGGSNQQPVESNTGQQNQSENTHGDKKNSGSSVYASVFIVAMTTTRLLLC